MSRKRKKARQADLAGVTPDDLAALDGRNGQAWFARQIKGAVTPLAGQAMKGTQHKDTVKVISTPGTTPHVRSAGTGRAIKSFGQTVDPRARDLARDIRAQAKAREDKSRALTPSHGAVQAGIARVEAALDSIGRFERAMQAGQVPAPIDKSYHPVAVPGAVAMTPAGQAFAVSAHLLDCQKAPRLVAGGKSKGPYFNRSVAESIAAATGGTVTAQKPKRHGRARKIEARSMVPASICNSLRQTRQSNLRADTAGKFYAGWTSDESVEGDDRSLSRGSLLRDTPDDTLWTCRVSSAGERSVMPAVCGVVRVSVDPTTRQHYIAVERTSTDYQAIIRKGKNTSDDRAMPRTSWQMDCARSEPEPEPEPE